MKKIFNIFIFVTIFVPHTWTVYVPELTRKSIHDDNGSIVLEKRTLQEVILPNDNINLFKLSINDYDNYDDQMRLLTVRQAKINTHQLAPILRQQKSYDIDDDVVLGAIKHTHQVQENLEAQPTGFAEQQQNKAVNNEVLKEIDEDKANYNTLHHSRQRRQLSDFLIHPNTRWCGRGNTANGTYNHLGGATMADKCCRTHDHCKVFIPAMSNRFEYFNYRPYTLSHCNCDRRFRTCLKMANDEDANTIGKFFFNLLQTQCFMLTKEVICQKKVNGACIKEYVRQKALLRDNKKY